MTIRRNTLETHVLSGLKNRLLHPDLIIEFVSAYRAEYNRLALKATRDKAKSEQELAKIVCKIDRIVETITEGMFHPSMKAKMDELEHRKTTLEMELAQVQSNPPVLLHPGLSDLYRENLRT